MNFGLILSSAMLLMFLTDMIYRSFIESIHERSCLFELIGKLLMFPVKNAEGQRDGWGKGSPWLSGTGIS